jgi:hypothetical protein
VKLILQERERGWSCNLGDHNPDVLSVAVGVELNGVKWTPAKSKRSGHCSCRRPERSCKNCVDPSIQNNI